MQKENGFLVIEKTFIYNRNGFLVIKETCIQLNQDFYMVFTESKPLNHIIIPNLVEKQYVFPRQSLVVRKHL